MNDPRARGDGPTSYRTTSREKGVPCPRCESLLARVPALDGALACAECGGVFLGAALVGRLEDNVELEELLEQTGAEVALIPIAAEVRYLRCPHCSATMNRGTFGRKSGVIIDSCKTHGAFFDAGELVAAVEFVASGGLERARAAAHAERAAERERLRVEARALGAALQVDSPRSSDMVGLLRRFLG